MKNEPKKAENEMVTIQQGKTRFVEKLGEAIGVKLPADAGLIRPITIFVEFLERKGVHFLQQISTKIIIEFRVQIFTHCSETDSEVIVAGVKSYLYLCAHEHWIDEKFVSLWDVLSEESLLTKGKQDICLN